MIAIFIIQKHSALICYKLLNCFSKFKPLTNEKITPPRFFAKILICLAIISVISIGFNSCKKETTDKTPKAVEQEIVTKKKPGAPGTYRMPIYCGDLANPCSDPACAQYYNCNLDPYAMTTLFSGVDHAQLQQLLSSNNLAALENFLSPIANQIANRIFTKYSEDIHDEIGNEPQGMVMLGLFEFGVENNFSLDSYNSSARKPYEVWVCFMDALTDAFGIAAIRSLYNDFLHGVSPRTVIRALKTIGTRAWLGLTVGWAIFRLGDCLDWW